MYEETLTVHRMEFLQKDQITKKDPLTPLYLPFDQSKCLAMLLEKRKAAYQRMNAYKGYTIQVYMGNSRIAALKAQECAHALQPIYTPALKYRQPYYRVRLGFFSDRLEAYLIYLSLIKKMPGIMIRPCVNAVLE